MRIDRGALWLALGCTLVTVPVAGARILGGGSPKKADCYLVFEGINATGSKPNVVECRDNDPACDGDTVAKQCTFTFTACVGATDTNVAGCTPGTVTKVTPAKAVKQTINYPPLPASAPACAASPTTLVFKLRKNGRPTKHTINFLARATGRPSRDTDHLVLRCDASPSGAFVMLEE